MIRIGQEKDLDSIMAITRACAKAMVEKGIYQWNDHYPNISTFTEAINRNELYVLELNSLVIGCIVISTLMDDEHIPMVWLTTTKNNIYIHRLSVHPKYQGRGYAQTLMEFAEIQTIENGYSSIRLDTFSQNKRNQKFYELRGYKRLSDIYL